MITTRRPRLRRAALAVAAAATLTAALPLASPAQAKQYQDPKLVVIGLGTTETTATGATYSADMSGTPLSGPSTGSLTPADGSLPGLGECEPATATLRVTEGKNSFELTSHGEVCAILLAFGTMQAFDGRFTVTSTTVPKIKKTTGIVDFRLMAGQADLYATSPR